MDDAEDDARYPPNTRVVHHQPGYGSSSTQKLPIRNASYSRPVNNQYVDEVDDEEEDDEDEEEVGDDVNVDRHQNNGISGGSNNIDDEDDEDDFSDDDDDDDEGADPQKNFSGGRGGGDPERRTKKRKLKSLVSSYEFAPRVPPPSEVAPSAPKPPFGGRNSLTDWSEHETFVLLDAWGERFLQRGRKSLRSDEWQEVAEKVSEVSKVERSDTQCRNRLDTLKKKYKKEKLKFSGAGNNSNSTSKWVYFKKMDVLMASPTQQTGLSCGLDSGEYVFMNPRVYLNRANGMDEMRDSPGNSEFSNKDGDDSDGLPPKKRRSRRESIEGSSFKLLADSIQKFSDIYEKIENSKRQQMVELEKMRMDFHRDLEFQRRQIMERAQAEIAKIRQGDEEENDHSGENASG